MGLRGRTVLTNILRVFPNIQEEFVCGLALVTVLKKLGFCQHADFLHLGLSLPYSLTT